MADWWMKTCCDACGKKDALIMSMYDERMICMSCKDEERKRPDYHEAEAKDLRAYAGRLDELGMQPHGDSVRKAADEIELAGHQPLE